MTPRARDATQLEGHAGSRRTDRSAGRGSNDILMSDVLRRHELQVWFVAEHVVDMPLIED
jgi:starvation-inducible DNA-binding protein